MTPKSLLFFLLFISTVAAVATAEDDWPVWRGPQGNGHYEGTLPSNWDHTNIAWQTRLEGRGQSSPITWKDRIFLTSAAEDGSKRYVTCLNRRTGELQWKSLAWSGEPEKTHRFNQFASATCVTDGERVVAFFGKAGIHCYDLSGKPLWSRQLGNFAGPWGTAASPVIVEDLVIQNCDAEDESYLVALDKNSGEIAWKTPRDRLRGWSSPLVVLAGSRLEIVLNGETGVNSYNPKTGEKLWFCRGDTGRGTPTVISHADFLIAVNGRSGDMIAVRGGGAGTVNSTHEVWRTKRTGVRDLPSPIVVGESLVVISYRPGTATSYDAQTGKEREKIRLGGNISASPIAADGRIYAVNETGELLVLQAAPKLKLLTRYQVDPSSEAVFRASLTPSRNQILCRSDRMLYCISSE